MTDYLHKCEQCQQEWVTTTLYLEHLHPPSVFTARWLPQANIKPVVVRTTGIPINDSSPHEPPLERHS